MSSVASSVTRQRTEVKKDKVRIMPTDEEKKTESGVMIQAPAVTPVKERVINKNDKNEVTMDIKETLPTSQDIGPVLSQGGTLLKSGLLDLIPDNLLETKMDTTGTVVSEQDKNTGKITKRVKTKDTQATRMDKTGAKEDAGFTTVTTCVKLGTIKATLNVNQIPTSNSYNTLWDDDEENNDEEKDEKLDTTKERSVDLLEPPSKITGTKKQIFHNIRDNIAQGPQQSAQQATKKKDLPRKPSPKQTPMVSGTFLVNDKKLRDHPCGFEYNENRLLQNRHHEVSLKNLAWYVASSKPWFARMKNQLSQDCGKILAAVAQEYKGVCQVVWQNATLELAKIANAECNKLNNTSSKILKEMGKAEVVQAQL